MGAAPTPLVKQKVLISNSKHPKAALSKMFAH
jgi:hypothetical protein